MVCDQVGIVCSKRPEACQTASGAAISRMTLIERNVSGGKGGTERSGMPFPPARGPSMAAGTLLLGVLLQAPAWASAGQAEENYLSRLQNAMVQTRSSLSTLSKSAEHAAREFQAGGRLWAAGRQADFISEACGRAGGLMPIAPLGRQTPASHDVVLYAVPGALNEADRKTLNEWKQNGATVVTFSSPAGLVDNRVPIDTVVNVVELWTWTGEFVGACTRLGAMPVLYQSYGLPGGPERGKKYKGKRFHDDLTIEPIAAGALGRQYLDQTERMLATIGKSEMPKIQQAAKWWGQAKTATVLGTGHMFPRHYQDPRTKTMASFSTAPAWDDKELLDGKQPPEFVFYLGYQFAPKKLVEQAKALKVKLVYTCVQPAQPPEPADNIRHIAPAWPLPDGCVTVPGYDIPILPASGVIQAAIYWAIAAERSKLAP